MHHHHERRADLCLQLRWDRPIRAHSRQATNLTPPTGATIAQICVETAPVRYRDDGIAQTASVCIPLAAGWCGPYAGPLSAIQFIAQSGSPTIDVSYYYSD